LRKLKRAPSKLALLASRRKGGKSLKREFSTKFIEDDKIKEEIK